MASFNVSILFDTPPYKLTKGFYEDSNIYNPDEVERFINDFIEKY